MNLEGTQLMTGEEWSRTLGREVFDAATADAGDLRESLRSTASGFDQYVAYVEAWRAANGLSSLSEWEKEFNARGR